MRLSIQNSLLRCFFLARKARSSGLYPFLRQALCFFLPLLLRLCLQNPIFSLRLLYIRVLIHLNKVCMFRPPKEYGCTRKIQKTGEKNLSAIFWRRSRKVQPPPLPHRGKMSARRKVFPLQQFSAYRADNRSRPKRILRLPKKEQAKEFLRLSCRLRLRHTLSQSHKYMVLFRRFATVFSFLKHFQAQLLPLSERRLPSYIPQEQISPFSFFLQKAPYLPLLFFFCRMTSAKKHS
ncbi:unknown [Eubacterium sp. CAG:841]|nr:unknown [Eubacterium sp. CAG:841]